MATLLFSLAAAIHLIASGYLAWRVVTWKIWRVWWLWLVIGGGMVLLGGADILALIALRGGSGSPAAAAFSAIALAAALTSSAGILGILPRVQNILQTREAFQREIELYRSAFQAAEQSMVIKDARSVYVAANTAYGHLLGKDAQALAGKTDFDFFPRPQADHFRQEERAVLQTGSAKIRHEEVVGIQGGRWLEVTRIPMGDGGAGAPTHLLVTARDITRSRAAEINLKEEARLLRLMQDAILDLSGAADEPSVLKSLLQWTEKMAGTPHLMVGLVEGSPPAMEIKTACGQLEKFLGTRVRPGEELLGKAWQLAQVVALPAEAKRSTGASRPSYTYQNQVFSAAAAFPLLQTSQVIGVLGVFKSETDQAISELEIGMIKRLAEIVSLVILRNRFTSEQVQALNEARQAIAGLQNRMKFSRLIASMATHFIHLPAERIDQGIAHGLEALGRFANVDRCYLYIFPKKGEGSETVYEWCADGIPSRREHFQELKEDGFTWWLGKLNRLETIYVKNPDELPLEAAETARSLRAQGIKSFTAVPLIAGRAVVGYLGLDSVRAELRWADDMLEWLKITGEMFINTLDRKWYALEQQEALARLNERAGVLEQINNENNLLANMGDLLQACRTADEAYPIIARSVKRLIPAASGALYIIRNVEDPAELVASWGELPHSGVEQELTINECWGLRRGRIYLVNDLSSAPLCGHLSAPLPEAYLCAPLIAQGEAMGLLHLRITGQVSAHRTAHKGTLADSEHLAQKIAEHIAPALSNLNLRDRLRSQAIRDPLTGLFNRRYMETTLDRELRRASRHGTTVGVIMFDIDRMKPINDTLGHDAGDYLLKTLGNLLMKTFRGEDVACRFGGDEFIVILPEASLANTWQRAEQLREMLKKIDMEYEGKPLEAVTLSVGVAVFPDHGTTAERLILSSDMAVYAAKSEGGDRVMVASASDE